MSLFNLYHTTYNYHITEYTDLSFKRTLKLKSNICKRDAIISTFVVPPHANDIELVEIYKRGLL